MAYDPRSLNDLGARARAFFQANLSGIDSALQQTFVYVAAKFSAMQWRDYDLRLEWIYRQLFTRTTTDIAVLRMQGADIGIYQKGAAAAAGLISGTGTPGQTYPAGVRYLSGGISFVTTAPFTAAGDGTFAAAVLAESRGLATNRMAGAVMNLADPALYPTLSPQAAVASGGLGGGADVEGVEPFRARILERKARPPQGGAEPDYERWAKEVPGVTAAWAVPFEGGIGSVVIYFLFAGRANGIPEPADIAVVQAYIDARRLLGASATVVVAPIASPVNITIDDLTIDNSDVRAAIARNIDALFAARVRPGTNVRPFVFSRSWISEAISVAAGEDSHRLVTPSGDLTFTGGHIPVPGTISYA